MKSLKIRRFCLIFGKSFEERNNDARKIKKLVFLTWKRMCFEDDARLSNRKKCWPLSRITKFFKPESFRVAGPVSVTRTNYDHLPLYRWYSYSDRTSIFISKQIITVSFPFWRRNSSQFVYFVQRYTIFYCVSSVVVTLGRRVVPSVCTSTVYYLLIWFSLSWAWSPPVGVINNTR